MVMGAVERGGSVRLRVENAYLSRMHMAPDENHLYVHNRGWLIDNLESNPSTWDRVERVFAPKVAGTRNLHERSRHLDLDFFVCFSSAASLIGLIAQEETDEPANDRAGRPAHRRSE